MTLTIHSLTYHSKTEIKEEDKVNQPIWDLKFLFL